jgi:hypothetical protein
VRPSGSRASRSSASRAATTATPSRPATPCPPRRPVSPLRTAAWSTRPRTWSDRAAGWAGPGNAGGRGWAGRSAPARRVQTQRASGTRGGSRPSARAAPEAGRRSAPAAREAKRAQAHQRQPWRCGAQAHARQVRSGSGLVAGTIRAGRQPCPQCSAPGRRRLTGQEAPAPPPNCQKPSLLRREGPPVRSATNPDPPHRTTQTRAGKAATGLASGPDHHTTGHHRQQRPTKTEPVDNTPTCGQAPGDPPNSTLPKTTDKNRRLQRRGDSSPRGDVRVLFARKGWHRGGVACFALPRLFLWLEVG